MYIVYLWVDAGHLVSALNLCSMRIRASTFFRAQALKAQVVWMRFHGCDLLCFILAIDATPFQFNDGGQSV